MTAVVSFLYSLNSKSTASVLESEAKAVARTLPLLAGNESSIVAKVLFVMFSYRFSAPLKFPPAASLTSAVGSVDTSAHCPILRCQRTLKVSLSAQQKRCGDEQAQVASKCLCRKAHWWPAQALRALTKLRERAVKREGGRDVLRWAQDAAGQPCSTNTRHACPINIACTQLDIQRFYLEERRALTSKAPQKQSDPFADVAPTDPIAFRQYHANEGLSKSERMMQRSP